LESWSSDSERDAIAFRDRCVGEHGVQRVGRRHIDDVEQRARIDGRKQGQT
jgi:hypothetical protein